MSYINCFSDEVLEGWIGDPVEQISLHCYSDADFAGCRLTKRSTTGGFCCFEGPNTFWPIGYVSKRQTAVSHSTPEAELVAADYVVRSLGVPMMDLAQVILSRPPVLHFHEDNQAAIAVIRSGRNPTMKHMGRTHNVSLAWLHERFVDEASLYKLHYERSERMRADVFTKGFVN